MARKREITGQAVIYTNDGVKVVDAEVGRTFNANYDGCNFKCAVERQFYKNMGVI